MKLFYCDVPEGNFGDDLNTYLWPRFLPDAFDGLVRFTPQEARTVDHEDPRDTLFVGIGTLILDKVPAGHRKVVFGSGCDGARLPILDGRWDIQCLRGPLTAKALGLDPRLAITDPAILVRLLPPASEKKTHRVSFMPHWCQAQSGAWQKICLAAGIHFVDPRWAPLDVLQAIASSEVLISEALHGAIVADALRVPWVAVSSKHTILDFKWKDWCGSVGLSYAPAAVPAFWRPRPHIGMLINGAKRMQAAAALASLMRAGRAQLSTDGVLENRLERLVGVLDGFCKERGLQFNRVNAAA